MKIVFAGSFAVRLVEPVRARLSMPCEVIAGDEAATLPRLAGADVLVSMTFTRAMAEAGSRLSLVQVPGAGLDRIDRGALRPGLHLANVHGHETGIAEYVIGSLIALSRSFGGLDAALRQGRWHSQWAIGAPAPPPWPELAGRTLGILGYGRIGAAVARRAAAFDMRICAIRRQACTPPPDGVAFVGGLERLDEVLREADHLAITLALSDSTRHLLDARRLALMKPSALLVNVARAEIVDEAALYRALANGGLAGAALDVWYRYPASAAPTPPSAQPFHELANVIMTPHVSGWTDGMLEARARVIADNIERIARGDLPVNAIDAAG